MSQDVARDGSTNLGQTIDPRIVPMLSKSNYPLWALRLYVYLEGQSLWEVVETEGVVSKKDGQALSIILRC